MSGKIMRESKVKEAVPVHFLRKYSEKERIEHIKRKITKYIVLNTCATRN
jgi:ribonuclease BN (tRNA processing enzyme)